MNSNSIITFVVEGSGRFPIDMLRYDQAWPATVQAGIDITTTEHHDDRGRRVVKLNATQQPTIGRWASFGWHVISVSPMPNGEARDQVLKNAARSTGFKRRPAKVKAGGRQVFAHLQVETIHPDGSFTTRIVDAQNEIAQIEGLAKVLDSIEGGDK